MSKTGYLISAVVFIVVVSAIMVWYLLLFIAGTAPPLWQTGPYVPTYAFWALWIVTAIIAFAYVWSRRKPT